MTTPWTPSAYTGRAAPWAHCSPVFSPPTRSTTDLKDAAGKVQPLGLVDGNGGQILNQLGGVAISWVLAIVGTLVILKIVDATVGLRITKEQESDGLDLSQHNEEGYVFEN